MMEKAHRRYVRIWRFFVFLFSGWIDRKFHYSHDMSELEKISGPVLIIPNHACKWDPVLVGMACRQRQVYFVMSEHMVRKPLVGKLMTRLFGLILRKKASTDLQVVRDCLAHVKAGHSICLFAEGDQSWDGVTGRVYPGTGKLVKMSGATLVTYRLEGSFLALPRWASGVRRGRIRGRIAGIYSPEELRKMRSEEILYTIERDLSFDSWEWQRSLPDGPVEFRGRRNNRDYAKGIQMLFYLCPGCGKIGTIRTRNDEIFCSCGFRTRLRNTGLLEPAASMTEHPAYDFTVLPGWDRWQRDELEKRVARILASGSEELLFRDGPVKLIRIQKEHKETVLCEGGLSLRFEAGRAVLSVETYSFGLHEISNMGVVLSERLLFSRGEEYYEIGTEDINIRKYLLVWEMVR